MKVLRRLGKALLLVVFALAFFLLYTFSIPYTHAFMPAVGHRGALALLVVSQALLLALGWGCAFAFPLAIVYGRLAALAGALMVLPVIWTFAQGLWERPGKLGSFAVNSVFPLSLAVLVPLLAYGAHRMRRRHEAHRELAGRTAASA